MAALGLSARGVEAEESYLYSLIEQAEQNRLALRDEWLTLVYYQTQSDGWLSQTKDAKFFNFTGGQADPEAELKATLQGYFDPNTDLGDGHPQCRFPARLVWLSRMLKIDGSRMPLVKCGSFAEWRRSIQAAGASIIFPAAYLNNPSSMFGHTFLRIDRKDQTDQTRLLAYSIGYAADVAPGSNPVSYIFRGLFGGYPGTFTGAPYYDKVIEYGDIEARDIWEYELDLTQEEVDQLVRHAWELQQIQFPYYFFDKNCSYRLLMLLEIARPGLKLTPGFGLYAIPADTVRVLEDHGLIRNKYYRPATVTRVLDKMEMMPVRLQDMAYRLARGEQKAASEDMIQLEVAEKAAALDLAYEYSRYLAQKSESAEQRKSLASVSMDLLRARSRIETTEASPAARPVQTSPENGHATARLDMGAGRLEDADFVSLRLRPAFHDVLDDDRGYTAGAQINFLDFELRHYPSTVPAGGNEWDLEYLEVVGIKSLALRNRFFKPYSWEVSAGWKRHHELPENTLRFVVDGAWGAAYGIRERVFFYGLAGAGLRSSADMMDEHEWSLLGKLGLLWNVYGNNKLKIETERREYDGSNASDGHILRLEFNLPLENDMAIRLEYEETSLLKTDFAQTRLGWRWYF
jgi:hypothetical protein